MRRAWILAALFLVGSAGETRNECIARCKHEAETWRKEKLKALWAEARAKGCTHVAIEFQQAIVSEAYAKAMVCLSSCPGNTGGGCKAPPPQSEWMNVEIEE